MNILIIGDSNSTFMRDYCENLFVNEINARVCILSYTSSLKYNFLYKEWGIEVIYTKPYIENCPICKTNIFPVLIKKAKEIKRAIPFDSPIDIIHVHYVDPCILVYLAILWIFTKRRILTFWGSDILRISEENIRLLSPFLHTASAISFMIPEQYHYFCEIYGKQFEKKVKIIDMGNCILDYIDELRSKDSKKNCKREFGITIDKIVIHIGYNKAEEQQHIKILEQICSLPKVLKQKCKFVFPWGYGSSDSEEYEARIEELLYNSDGVDFEFVRDFFEGEKLAKFRMTSDIFIYGQTTDAMSDSCVEYIYSGSYFLCPSRLWKNYAIINDISEKCLEYEDFEYLSDTLAEILENEKHYDNCIQSDVKKVIQREKTWKNLVPKWKELY